ncbi:MAG: type VI secretion system tip protein TssI/VgrG [Bryobacteraceae bacterium]
MSFTQANRLLAIETPLGEDILLIENFTCSERISGLFQIQANCAVELANLAKMKAERLIGAPVNIRIRVRGTKERLWNGIVRRVAHTSKDATFGYFTLDIVPKIWRLAHQTDCRIYQGKKVPEVVEEILGEFGITPFRFDLQKSYTPWDYCVMYRESFLQFISRLLEQEGLFYFFEHERGSHTLKIADHPGAHPKCPIDSEIRYQPEAGSGTEDDDDMVARWESAEELRPGVFTMRDHHFQLPAKNLEVTERTLVSLGGNTAMEVFDYPGEYAQLFVDPDKRLDQVQSEGERVVRLRMESEEVSIRSFAGTGFAVTLASGYQFELKQHYFKPLNTKYVLTTVQHQATQTPAYRGSQAALGAYRNSFKCIPLAVPFRPVRQTPKPVVQGLQTAIVTGPPGEEIYTDKYGRVKVRFFWDRRSPGDDKSSGWLRVATPWAGNHWGMIHIPRVGQEVVVEFLEGDPDQPMVTNSVYNADQMPPYTLPDHKTQSGIKSRSSKNGTPKHFNEIRFEDLKGREQIYIHAENSLSTVVEGSESRAVGGSRNTTIQKDDTCTLKEGSSSLIIEQRSRLLWIQEGSDSTVIDKGNSDIEVTLGKMTTSVPAGTYKVTAKEIELEATDKITIKCGGSSIELTSANIKAVSAMIDLNP